MSDSVQELPVPPVPPVPLVPVVPVNHASAGAILRAAREKSGLHLAVLSVNLKVSIKQLEALEGDRYEKLLEPVFARALASKVCRILKIDAVPVLALMPPMTNGLKPLLLVDTGNEPPYKSKPNHLASNGLVFGGLKFWLLILATGLLVLGYSSEFDFNVMKLQPQPAVTEVVPTMPPAQEPVASDSAQVELPKAMVFESATPATNSTTPKTSKDPISSN